MNGSKIVEVFKDGNIVIPVFLLKKYKELGLELDEFIFLMYLYGKGDKFLFNPNEFGEDLNLELGEVMTLVGNLTDKGFISVSVLKNEKGYMEEVVLLDNYYNKIKLFIIGEINKKTDDDINNSDVYQMIEKEFGRTISPYETEIISAWLQNNFSEELIKEAVKEATFNGVSNLKYIDKILYEWGKKGINTVQDVEKNRKSRNALKEKKKEAEADIDMDIMDWDWFDDDGDE